MTWWYEERGPNPGWRWTATTPKPRRGSWPRCGARTKATGQPCRARALPNGRCKFHGGLSTGPKTPEGKRRALANLRWQRGRAKDDGGG